MCHISLRRKVVRALFGAALLLGASGQSSASSYYKITVLDSTGGVLGPGQPQSLNNLGQVAGTWWQSASPHGAGGNYAYFYDPTTGGKVSLPGISSPSGQDPGSYNSQGSFIGINNTGQAVGWNSQGTILFDSKTGQVTNVPAPSGPITDSGQIFGSGYQLAGWPPHLYSYQNGTVQDLGLPPGAVAVSNLAAVNNSGQVAVNADMGSGQAESFLYSGGKWTALPNFVSAAMNAQGTLAGSSFPTAQGNAHAVVIPAGGTPIDIGTLPGDTYATAAGINSHGQVVGFSFKQNNSDLYQGFLYQNGVMTNLNSLIAANSGWLIRSALSINDLGQILALGENSSGNHALLLTPDGLPTPPDPVFPEMPVPEPSTIAVFAFLGAAFVSRKYLRS